LCPLFKHRTTRWVAWIIPGSKADNDSIAVRLAAIVS
jgi:hypothetical protein